jgi:hypothetical protein
VGGIGELFGISCWSYLGFGDLASRIGEVGLVSQLSCLDRTRADMIGILMRKLSAPQPI